MGERRLHAIAYGLMALLAVLPPVLLSLEQPFYVDLVARMMVFAIAALSLDLLLGFGGMVSFGHAVYLGIGGYTVAILSFYGITNGFVHFVAAVLCSALAALLIGAISLRTSGVFFIMITLAFSQMVYFLAISVNTFGGDDGLPMRRPSELAGMIDLRNSASFYYFALTALAIFLWIGSRMMNSRFGMLLRGIKFNERRMAALGFPTLRYKLATFVISGGLCGFAGALLANQTLFVSPSIMHWFRSGELLIMVIAGGMGTLVGPIIGSILYLLLERVLSSVTVYWGGAVGVVLVALVLMGKRGIVGFLIKPRGKSRAAV